MTLRRRIRRLNRRLGRAAMARLGPHLLRALALTWRVEVLGGEHLEGLRASGAGFLVALWHGRIPVGMPLFVRCGWLTLASESRDGEAATLLLRGLRYEVIRGSTSAGAARALRELRGALDEGRVVVITPDGPRGPRHRFQGGLAWLAGVTGHPVLPIGFACKRAWHGGSWDRSTIPRPFSRVVISYGEPVHVPRTRDAEAIEAASRLLREALLRAERAGFERLRMEPDW